MPRKEIFTPILIVFTSVVFGGAHALNWMDSTSLPAILMTISAIGFAMVACFLVLNYGIIWSILLHVVWNSIIIALILVGSPHAGIHQVKTACFLGGKEEQQANNLMPPAKHPSHRPHRSACNTERI